MILKANSPWSNSNQYSLFNIRYSLLLAIIILLIGSSCKGAKRASTNSNLKPKSVNFLLKRLVKNDYEPEWLSAKGKLRYEDDYQTFRGTFYLRMRRDSVIWLNVKKFSVEGARILITQDSVYAINRLEKSYIVYPLDQLEQRMGIPLSMEERPKGYETNFRAIQSLLFGYPPLLGDKKNWQAGVIEDKYMLTSDQAIGGQPVMIDYEINSSTFLLHLMRLLQPNTTQLLEIEQGDYHLHEESWNFPYFRQFRIKTPEYGKISIQTELTKVEFNQSVSIKFSIPDHYDRISD